MTNITNSQNQEKGSTKTFNENLNLTVNESYVLLIMSLAAKSDGSSVFMSFSTIARQTRMHIRTVIEVVKSLIKKGYAAKVPSSKNGLTNQYELNLCALQNWNVDKTARDDGSLSLVVSDHRTSGDGSGHEKRIPSKSPLEVQLRTKLDNALAKNRSLKITAGQRNVLKSLMSYGDIDGSNCFQSIQTIVDDTGFSRRYVEKCLKYLRDCGLIIIVQKHSCVKFQPTKYQINTAMIYGDSTI